MEVFVARQPIFDREQKVYGYELLFRNGLENFYQHVDGDEATSSVLSNSFLSIGIEKLTRRKLAFINFTRKLLLEEVATAFPRDLLAVEILENVEPEQAILNSCLSLKAAGYPLVLDDFVFDEKFLPLMAMADIIKVDFRSTPPEQCAALVERCRNQKIKFLAEKVETRKEFDLALGMGYSYFQGYFFSKPETISAKEVPGYKLSYLQLLKEIYKSDIDFVTLEAILKRDVSLSFKFLKFVNSAGFGIVREITSIRQALVMLGLREIKKWITVVGLSSIGVNKPQELMVQSLARAHFCERMAALMQMKQRSEDFFLMGLFSAIDAFLDRPMAEVLSQIPISYEVKAALQGEKNSCRPVYDIMMAHEVGDWASCSAFATAHGLDPWEMQLSYLKALEYSTQIFEKS